MKKVIKYESPFAEALKLLNKFHKDKEIRVCDECGVPMIWTFLWAYRERYCLNCATSGGTMGTGTDVELTDALKYEDKVIQDVWKAIAKNLLYRSRYTKKNCKKCEVDKDHNSHLLKSERLRDKTATEILKKLMENAHIKINRVWSMPSSHTFTIKPIKELLKRYVIDPREWIDPFAGEHSIAHWTNDLNPKKPTMFHLEATDFVRKMKKDESTFDGALFDPPYSLRQIMECYEGIGLVPDKKWATTKFYTDVKNGLARVIKPGGICISFGWNTIGLGKKRGFEIIEVLVVSHGRLHNDTLVTVERKNSNPML